MVQMLLMSTDFGSDRWKSVWFAFSVFKKKREHGWYRCYWCPLILVRIGENLFNPYYQCLKRKGNTDGTDVTDDHWFWFGSVKICLIRVFDVQKEKGTRMVQMLLMTTDFGSDRWKSVWSVLSVFKKKEHGWYRFYWCPLILVRIGENLFNPYYQCLKREGNTDVTEVTDVNWFWFGSVKICLIRTISV